MGPACRLVLSVSTIFVSTFFRATADGLSLTARKDGEQITISMGEALVTAYKFSSDQKYPFLYPVNGPLSGKSVTTESAEPYPHHHSLFFGCDRVNGGNYWQEGNERGQIRSQGPSIVQAEGERIVVEDECLWQIPAEDAVMRDRRRITVSVPSPTLRIIDFEITLDPLVDITIEKTNHSLFSARMAPELSVSSGGTLVNAQGDHAEAGTFGVKSPWCDYSGTRDGIREGLALFQHPSNPWYPAAWFTRDYGFFSPTPMYWPEGESTFLARGKKVVLRYRVVVHGDDTSAETLGRLFTEYSGE